jgi:cytochrome P450
VFDPRDPEFLADPYAEFALLREQGEVHWHDGLGLSIAVSHSAASAVLRHRALGRIWSDVQPAEQFVSFNLLHRNSLLENEPPAHTRLRSSISAAFNRGHVERLRPTIGKLAQHMVDGLIAHIAADGEADLLDHLAQPLPVAVIAELLDIPEADRSRLVQWSNAIVKMYEYGLPEDGRRAAENAAAEFSDYLRKIVESRREQPGEDLVTGLLRAELTEDEVVATAVLLLMAGHEATVNVIGNGVWALLRHRCQWQRLLEDPSLVEVAVEEMIRYDAPLQLFVRTATEDVEIADFRVARGEKIAALLGAAARDPQVFTEPDRFDVGRTPNQHLGFGAGIHYCIGAPLARIEIAAAVRALLEKTPTLRITRKPGRKPEFAIRGLRDFPVSA